MLSIMITATLLMILIALFAIGLMSMVIAQVATTELAITANIPLSSCPFTFILGALRVVNDPFPLVILPLDNGP